MEDHGTKTERRADAALLQREYCRRHAIVDFTPQDGICYRCGADIYSHRGGYDGEYAASRHITCCPHCHATFID